MTMSTSSSSRQRGPKRKLMIVDDHPIVRRGLAELLARELDVDVCGGADNVADALVEVEKLRPDLVVVDMSLRDSHGIELIAQIAERWPEVKTLAWSMFDEKVFAERAVQAGAMGYLNKKEPIENVVQIEWVMGDGTHDGGTVDGEYAATTTGVCDWRDADEEYLDGYVQAYWAIGTTQMGVTRARSSEDDPWSMVGLGGLEWDADEAGPAPEIYVDDAVSVAVVMDGVRMTTWGGGPSREAVVTGSMECDLQ